MTENAQDRDFPMDALRRLGLGCDPESTGLFGGD